VRRGTTGMCRRTCASSAERAPVRRTSRCGACQGDTAKGMERIRGPRCSRPVPSSHAGWAWHGTGHAMRCGARCCQPAFRPGPPSVAGPIPSASAPSHNPYPHFHHPDSQPARAAASPSGGVRVATNLAMFGGSDSSRHGTGNPGLLQWQSGAHRPAGPRHSVGGSRVRRARRRPSAGANKTPTRDGDGPASLAGSRTRTLRRRGGGSTTWSRIIRAMRPPLRMQERARTRRSVCVRLPLLRVRACTCMRLSARLSCSRAWLPGCSS
jgi:hypothetical protein